MIKKLTATTILSLLTFSAFAGNVNDLSKDSSWEDIMSHNNIQVRGDGIRVGSTNTSVFFVEEKDGVLYTLKPTRDGYYKNVRSGGDNDRTVWVQTGESVKSGDVTISVPVYETKRINSEKDEQIVVGRKDYIQPLTRSIEVYEVKHSGNDKGAKERLLFTKEFTVPTKS